MKQRRTIKGLFKRIRILILDAWYLIRIWLKNNDKFPPAGKPA